MRIEREPLALLGRDAFNLAERGSGLESDSQVAGHVVDNATVRRKRQDFFCGDWPSGSYPMRSARDA
jgi:hypothetical protein